MPVSTDGDTLRCAGHDRVRLAAIDAAFWGADGPHLTRHRQTNQRGDAEKLVAGYLGHKSIDAF
jgi:hypothetical protein